MPEYWPAATVTSSLRGFDALSAQHTLDIRMYLELLCPNAVDAVVGMSQAKTTADIRHVTFESFPYPHGSRQSVVVMAFRHEVEEVARTVDDPLRVRRSGRDIYAHRTLDDDFLVADLKFNF